ncbi:MAG TPA: choice-of-anchor L domain-containing protein, partial [Thermoanaerobaculia bacterium]
GAKISNVRITGANGAIGSFSDAAVLGIESGVVLSTGNIADAAGPNSSTGTGASLGTAGHPALDAIVAPLATHDAIVIDFDVVTESPTFVIKYVFASEEYREWVDSEFNDVFAFFVNGANIALTPGTEVPVTINTINHHANTTLYRDNEGGTGTEFDGYTTPLLAIAIVEPGVSQHIRIAIADSSDGALDSAVFIAQGGISGSQIPPIILPTANAIEGRVGEEIVVPLQLYYAFESSPPAFTATGLPGASIEFTPMYRRDGIAYVDMKIVVGPETPGGEHVVTIRGGVPNGESFAALVVVVDCKPPSILGTGQPVTQTVDRGQPATFTVAASGSGPQTFQWYAGNRGMTGSPIAGATGATLKTGAVNEETAYWVRVSNACGTTDSLTAYARPR